MKNPNFFGAPARRLATALGLAFASLLIHSQPVVAAGWNGIEPLKSRRADVEKALGQPIQNQPGQDGTLHFKVMGGMVTVTFVTARFVAAHKLYPELEGTVLQVVLQHEKSSETPESMLLAANSNFKRQDVQAGTIFLNQKDGLTYTFVNGQLKTTRYSASASQLGKARKG